MSNWKTSNCDSANETRHWIGLQFFAEGGDGGAEGAGMDGDFEDDFAAGLMDGDLENQQDDAQPQGEGGAEGLENQQAGGREDEPGQNEGGEPPQQGEQQPQEEPGQNEGGEPPQQGEQQPQEEPPKFVPLTYNGKQIMLPEAAVQQVRDALGMDPIQLLQKGMNYDQKAARELHLLDQYAAASGLNRQQFISQLEQAQRQKELQDELQRVKAEFPETPDTALMEIAKNRMASRQAARQQEQMQRQQTLQAVQDRAQTAVQQARRQAQINAWDEYEKIAGVHKPEDIPARVNELVQEGMTPTAAHWRYQAEQAQQQVRAQQKDKQNRSESMGSMAGTGDPGGDDFLSGLFG